MTNSTDAMPALYLASASPRRRELLAQIAVAHQVLQVPAPPGEDEPRHPGEPGAAYVRRTAREKAWRGDSHMRSCGLPPLPLLAADTTVILRNEVLGKPVDRAHAVHMLRQLSGSRHEVHTAVALCANGTLYEDVSITWVNVRELAVDEIDRYCETGEPYGKAGAYGIQGLAATFITRIEGSYTGVMGLPLYETAQLLRHAGIRLP